MAAPAKLKIDIDYYDAGNKVPTPPPSPHAKSDQKVKQVMFEVALTNSGVRPAISQHHRTATPLNNVKVSDQEQHETKEDK